MKENLKKAQEHMHAKLAKFRELEAQGYRSGGYDFATDRTEIVKGEYPNAEIVGYLNRDLTITWKK